MEIMPILDAVREMLETQKEVVIKDIQAFHGASWFEIATAIQKNPHLTSITFPESGPEYFQYHFINDINYIATLAQHPTLVTVNNLYCINNTPVSYYKYTSAEPLLREEFAAKKQLLDLKSAWQALLSQLNNQEANWLDSLKKFYEQLSNVQFACSKTKYQQGLFNAFYVSIKDIYEPLCAITNSQSPNTQPPKELHIPCYHELLCRYLAESICYRGYTFIEKLVLVNVPNITEPGRMINSLRQLIKNIPCLAFKDCDIAQIEALILKTTDSTHRFKAVEFINCTNLHNLQVMLTSQKRFAEFKSNDKQNKSQRITTSSWSIKNQVMDDAMTNALVNYYQSVATIKIMLDNTYIQNDQLKKLIDSLQPGTNLSVTLAGNTLESVDCTATLENKNIHLTEFSLQRTLLTTEQLASIVTVLASAPALQWLNLNDVCLASQCNLTALAPVVVGNKNLLYLNLDRIKNSVVNDTCAFLIAVLKAKLPLISLSLDNTFLSSEAINEVIAFINDNKTLCYLDLTGVGFTLEQLAALTQALENNTSLEYISSTQHRSTIKTYMVRNRNKDLLAQLIKQREQLARSSFPSEWAACVAGNQPVSKDMLQKVLAYAGEILELRQALCPNSQELYTQGKAILLQAASHIWKYGVEPDADLAKLNQVAIQDYFSTAEQSERTTIFWALVSALVQHGKFDDAERTLDEWTLNTPYNSQTPQHELEAMYAFYKEARCDWFVKHKRYNELLQRFSGTGMGAQQTWLHAAYDGYFQNTPVTLENIGQALKYANEAKQAKHPHADHMLKHCYRSYASALQEYYTSKHETWSDAQIGSFLAGLISNINGIFSLPHTVWDVKTLERPLTLLAHFATYAKRPLRELLPLTDIAIHHYTEYGVPPDHPLYETWLQTYLCFIKANIRYNLLPQIQENHKQYFLANIRFTNANTIAQKLDKASTTTEWVTIIDILIKENTRPNTSKPAYLSWLSEYKARIENTLELLAQRHSELTTALTAGEPLAALPAAQQLSVAPHATLYSTAKKQELLAGAPPAPTQEPVSKLQPAESPVALAARAAASL